MAFIFPSQKIHANIYSAFFECMRENLIKYHHMVACVVRSLLLLLRYNVFSVREKRVACCCVKSAHRGCQSPQTFKAKTRASTINPYCEHIRYIFFFGSFVSSIRIIFLISITLFLRHEYFHAMSTTSFVNLQSFSANNERLND